MWMWPALILSVVLGAFGQILMKEALKTAGPVPLASGIAGLASYFFYTLLSWQMFGAFLCYGLSFALWIAVLSIADLSLARPMMSAGYLITLAYGVFAGEEVTPGRVIGTCLIVIGIAFIVRSGLK